MTADDEICLDYIWDLKTATGITILASILVFLINYGIGIMIVAAAAFEKHPSVDVKERSIFIRMLVLRFINMGCIFLINQDRYQLSEVLNVEYSYSPNLSISWYFSVGTTVILVQVRVQVFSSILYFKF